VCPSTDRIAIVGALAGVLVLSTLQRKQKHMMTEQTGGPDGSLEDDDTLNSSPRSTWAAAKLPEENRSNNPG
jgi:hypothetical protein